ncbi:hypothetical protein RB600_005210 [Gaeumannomyces tritici]
MKTKPAFQPPGDGAPPEIDFRSTVVVFRHPAYPNAAPPLLELGAWDEDEDGNNGLDYDTALVACGIIANNAFASGRLAVKNDGAFQTVLRPPNNLLRAATYYFCIGDNDPSSNKYPVVPSFDHWRFPPTLPSPWDSLQIAPFAGVAGVGPADVVRSRDVTCRISGHENSREAAHIIPVADGYWFQANRMSRYCRNPSVVHHVMDDKNILLLRSDLHSIFDARRFTFTAKFGVNPTSASSPTGSSSAVTLILHVLQPSLSSELVHLYHNRQLQPVRGLAPEFLLARFAWSLFTDELYPFFSGMSLYNVLLYNRDTMELEEDSLPGHAIRAKMRVFPTYTTTGSKSPRKRPHDEAPGEGVSSGDDEDTSSDEDEVDPRPPRGARPLTAADLYKEERRLLYGDDAVSSDEEDRRGRTMKRRFEDFESPPPGLGASFRTASEASMSTAPFGVTHEAAAAAAGLGNATCLQKDGVHGREGKRQRALEGGRGSPDRLSEN